MITGLYAALLGLIFVGLTLYVVKGRFAHRVSLGDGGHVDMERRIRAHGNFIEQAPMGLILLALCEMQGAPLSAIHAMGIMLVLSRSLHPWGLLRVEGTSFGRMVGMVLGLIMILSACVFLIWKFAVQLI